MQGEALYIKSMGLENDLTLITLYDLSLVLLGRGSCIKDYQFMLVSLSWTHMPKMKKAYSQNKHKSTDKYMRRGKAS